MEQLPGKVIGHRGLCNRAPENTLSGMRAAKLNGLTWVEFDVMLTHDGMPILIHDTTLNRTSNGQGAVANCTYSDIIRFDVGSHFSADYKGEVIPTLKEAIACLGELNLAANIEIKPSPGQDAVTAVKVIETLVAYWPVHLPTPLISSFSQQSMQTVFDMQTNYLLGYLADPLPIHWQQRADQLQCCTVHVNYCQLTPELVSEIKQTGRAVLAYTVNSVELAKKLFSWGVDSVFSDEPLDVI